MSKFAIEEFYLKRFPGLNFEGWQATGSVACNTVNFDRSLYAIALPPTEKEEEILTDSRVGLILFPNSGKYFVEVRPKRESLVFCEDLDLDVFAVDPAQLIYESTKAAQKLLEQNREKVYQWRRDLEKKYVANN